MLLHEYGHVFYRHPGNKAVPPDVSRANEQAADKFALDQFVRVGDMPIGVPILFFTMADLMENRAEYASDAEYQLTLAARTHPVSPARLQSLARHMSERASDYDANARPGSQASALAIALEISQFAHLLADPGVQWLSARVARPSGRRIWRRDRAAPSWQRPATQLPLTQNSMEGCMGRSRPGPTPVEVDVVLERHGSQVSGSYSFGAGFGRFEGQIQGATLSYRWALAADKGVARITLNSNGDYDGTWGIGTADAGGGSIHLRRQ